MTERCLAELGAIQSTLELIEYRESIKSNVLFLLDCHTLMYVLHG